MKHTKHLFLFLFFFSFLVFSSNFITATEYGYDSVKSTGTSRGFTNVVVNVSANHNDLLNIQGGSLTERYHLPLGSYNNISYLINWTTTIGKPNPFNQVLNTTSNVSFKEVNITSLEVKNNATTIVSISSGVGNENATIDFKETDILRARIEYSGLDGILRIWSKYADGIDDVLISFNTRTNEVIIPGNLTVNGSLSAPNICYSNGTGCLSTTNSSWNQSLTDTLYANISWNYNQTIPAIDYINANYYNTSTSNNLFCYANGTNSSGINCQISSLITSINTTQFSNTNGVLNILESWLRGIITGYGYLTSSFNSTYDVKADYQFGSNNFQGSGNVNTSGNISSEGGYVRGQPIRGMLGSGIIDSLGETGIHISSVNVTCIGLNCNYTGFEMRIQSNDAGAMATYCKIPNGTVTVPDNAFTLYYVDSNCAIQTTSYANWFTNELSQGSQWDFFSVLTQNGATELVDSLSLEKKRLTKLRVLTYYQDQAKVISGFNFQANAWASFNITAGKSVFGMDVVNIRQHNVTATQDEIEVVGHLNATNWIYSDQRMLNVTYCDNGTAVVICTGNNWRRHFIFHVGYDEGSLSSELHQLYPSLSTTYASAANCIDTNINPLSYVLPSQYEGAAVILYAYCAKRTDTSWVTTNLIDLRTVKTGSATSIAETDPIWSAEKSNYVPYTGATSNVDLGSYNVTANSVLFQGSVNNFIKFNGSCIIAVGPGQTGNCL